MHQVAPLRMTKKEVEREKPQGLKPLSYMEMRMVGQGGYVGDEAPTP
jgi:hypothetical protein